MRVTLTPEQLATQAGKELLEITVRITLDGKLDAAEIKDLFRWLTANQANGDIAAIPYLRDIILRAAADKVVDRDELMELHLAIERVIPPDFREGIKGARKSQEAAKRDRDREKKRLLREEQKAKEKEERDRLRAEDREKRMRLRHQFAKVSGVSFPNDDGTERQTIVRQCRAGEALMLEHDPNNRYSAYAIKLLRTNGQQLGHAPEYLAERICDEWKDGYKVAAMITEVTGGTVGKEYCGVNFVVFFVADSATADDYARYVQDVMARR